MFIVLESEIITLILSQRTSKTVEVANTKALFFSILFFFKLDTTAQYYCPFK